MARRPTSHPDQLDLLGWSADRVVRRFAAELIRAASLATRLCRGLKLSLAECGASRQEVAQRMSDFLGEDVSIDMLNAYTAESKPHIVNAVRLVAFIAATRDHRALNALLDELGLVVIEKRYLPLIDLAIAREERDIADRKVASARRRAQQGRHHD